MNTTLADAARPFLDYIEQWQKSLPSLKLEELASQKDRLAIISVDIITGFCSQGALSSPLVGAIETPIAGLLQRAWNLGVRNIIFTQDTHEPDAVEFSAFPPHCIRGTVEAETAAALKALPFYDQVTIIEKNSISSGLNTGMQTWMDAHPQVDTFIVVGDCTDLCIYQMAMHLRLDANSRQLQRRVIVPANVVATYDRLVADAQSQGGFAHGARFLNSVFLYHLALNGVELGGALD
mgnify:CR=1 FL=1